MAVDITERQKDIMEHLIEKYVVQGEPVSSQCLLEEYELSYSAATIRKEMSILEQMGYLYSPHTSSGRVPTDVAFSFYIHNVAEVYDCSIIENKELEEFYFKVNMQLEELMLNTAQLLATTSQCAGFVLAPVLESSIIQRVELVSIRSDLVLIIIISTSGAIYQKKVITPIYATQEMLYKVSLFLNQYLPGYDIQELQALGLEAIEKEANVLGDMKELALYIIQSIVYSPPEQKLYITGENSFYNRFLEESYNTLLDKKEFADELTKKVKDKIFIKNILSNLKYRNELKIQVGLDLDGEYLSGISILAKDYSVAGRSVGSLGVVGVTRMLYKKIIPTLYYSSHILSEALEIQKSVTSKDTLLIEGAEANIITF